MTVRLLGPSNTSPISIFSKLNAPSPVICTHCLFLLLQLLLLHYLSEEVCCSNHPHINHLLITLPGGGGRPYGPGPGPRWEGPRYGGWGYAAPYPVVPQVCGDCFWGFF